MSGRDSQPTVLANDLESLKARVFDGKGWSKTFVEGALIHDLWAEVERLRAELKQADHRSFQAGRICYRGFSYGVGSQVGIDSLRRAIEGNGHG